MDQVTRRRELGEFFGIERLLWDDRHSGALYEHYVELLDGARRELAAELAAGAGNGAPTARVQTLLQAVEAARDVLSAARQALLECEVALVGRAPRPLNPAQEFPIGRM